MSVMIKKILVTLFTIYELSAGNSRMLLQTPYYVPIPTDFTPIVPSIPSIPPPVVTTPPVVVIPTLPVVTQPPLPVVTQPQPPIVPTQPVVVIPPLPVVTQPHVPQPPAAVPEGYVYGAHHQLCPLAAIQQSTKCPSNTNIATMDGDSLFCEQTAECCMCSSIQCGKHGVPCNEVVFGESGAYGVRDIQVSGDPDASVPGASIHCQGVESCRGAEIIADHVSILDCQGDKSCEGATITITDPKPGFAVNCAGLGACGMLQIDINFSAPPPGFMCRAVAVKDILEMEGIFCSNSAACEGLEITINNDGCDKVLMDTVECNQYQSCTAAIFNFVGDIDVSYCECGPSCVNTQGLDLCFENLEFLSCPDSLSCMGVTKTITNPMNSFELKCGDVKSCANANFDIVLNTDYKEEAVRFIKGIFLSGESAGRGATFTVENKQGLDAITGLPIELEMERIECAGLYSCVDATFIIGSDVSVVETICAMGACHNCVIKRDFADVGVPCSPNEIAAPVGGSGTTTTTTTTTTVAPVISASTTLSKLVPITPVSPAV